MKNTILLTFICLVIYGCTKEVPCGDGTVQMAFKSFNPSDLDTIILRKFEANDKYKHLIDTVSIFYDSSFYLTNHDTTIVLLNGSINGIKAHYDWQIFIPAINRTVLISGIVSEQASSKCGKVGEPLGCGCTNKIFSLKNDNAFVDLSNVDHLQQYYYVYIYK